MTAHDLSPASAPAIDIARKADYPELMRLLDLAFGKQEHDWFAQRNAARYRPTDESMGQNLIARRSGAIAACVGIFPITLHIGDRSLRIAGIGGVCTHPAHRGEGLMRHLMAETCRVMEREAYPLSFLTGQRQRYAYFGWEKAGLSIRARMTRDNLRHRPASDGATAMFSVAPLMRPTDQDLTAMKRWHDALPLRCDRPASHFSAYLTHWGASTYVARDATNALRGYAVVAEDGREISELAAADADAAMHLVSALTMERDGVEVDLGCVPGKVGAAVLAVAESASAQDVFNWKVLDWRATIEPLLAARAAAGTVDGAVVLSIEGSPQALRLTIQAGQAEVEWTDDAPDLPLAGDVATRLLFGPLKPGAVCPLPPEAQILDAWCPLPLWLGRQDHI